MFYILPDETGLSLPHLLTGEMPLEKVFIALAKNPPKVQLWEKLNFLLRTDRVYFVCLNELFTPH